jgi:hypothetical protein
MGTHVPIHTLGSLNPLSRGDGGSRPSSIHTSVSLSPRQYM